MQAAGFVVGWTGRGQLLRAGVYFPLIFLASKAPACPASRWGLVVANKSHGLDDDAASIAGASQSSVLPSAEGGGSRGAALRSSNWAHLANR